MGMTAVCSTNPSPSFIFKTDYIQNLEVAHEQGRYVLEVYWMCAHSLTLPRVASEALINCFNLIKGKTPGFQGKCDALIAGSNDGNLVGYNRFKKGLCKYLRPQRVVYSDPVRVVYYQLR